MTTKPKRNAKKLTARARKKELTGINLAAIHKRLEALETWQALTNGFIVQWSHELGVKGLFRMIVATETEIRPKRKKGKR